MIKENVDTAPLLAAIGDALDLIGKHGNKGFLVRAHVGAALAEPAQLPSLLDQCRALKEQSRSEGLEPIRTLHHFACTGGTLISKCLMALPNTFVMSEIDPLSNLGIDPRNPIFAPTDLIRHLRYSLRPVEQETILQVFLAGLEILAEDCRRNGRRLVLRDHAHSHFCHGPDVPQRPALRQIVARIRPVRSVLTVRNPMESYLSLLRNKWLPFQPTDIGEYSRRYLNFLDTNAGVPIFRYEDFVGDPAVVLADICAALGLPFNVHALNYFDAVRLTGDSGRSSAEIGPRPARPVPEQLAEAANESADFKGLCQRLGY